MKHKTILFIVGLLILFFGAMPLLKEVPFFSGIVEKIEPCNLLYQILLVLIGLISIVFSLKKKKKKVKIQEE